MEAFLWRRLEHTLVVSRLILGVLATLVVLVFAAKRVLWLTKLISSGQKVGDERGRKDDLVQALPEPEQGGLRPVEAPGSGRSPVSRTSSPCGASSSSASVYLEAYGVLFDPEFHIPFVGRWAVLGFLQDFFAVAVLLGIIVFAIIRVSARAQEARPRIPLLRLAHRRRLGDPVHDLPGHRDLRAVPRCRRQRARRGVPYQSGAFFSDGMACAAGPARRTPPTCGSRRIALLGHIGVMLVFLLIVLHSKHLHIGLAPINVTFKRLPDGLGPLLPMEYKGEPIDFEDPAEDAVFGRGKIEDFTWKGYLDFTTCTECGRCQSQCPAWNTGKPLSPKLVIMNLRDHLFAKAPYILERQGNPLENTPEGGLGEESAARSTMKHAHDHVPESGFERIPRFGPEQATCAAGRHRSSRAASSIPTCCGPAPTAVPASSSARSTSSTSTTSSTCAATRSWSNPEFPGELGVLFKNLETKGNPWGQNAKDRTNWIDEVDFDVPVYGEDVDSLRRLRVPVLGRLRRRLRGPRQEDHQGRRRTARRPRA